MLAITLTHMVLDQQKRSEAALHMKIEESIYAVGGARDEIAEIETESEEGTRSAALRAGRVIGSA